MSLTSIRAQDDPCAPDTPAQALPRKMETNLDDEEAYLNQKKVRYIFINENIKCKKSKITTIFDKKMYVCIYVCIYIPFITL